MPVGTRRNSWYFLSNDVVFIQTVAWQAVCNAKWYGIVPPSSAYHWQPDNDQRSAAQHLSIIDITTECENERPCRFTRPPSWVLLNLQPAQTCMKLYEHIVWKSKKKERLILCGKTPASATHNLHYSGIRRIRNIHPVDVWESKVLMWGSVNVVQWWEELCLVWSLGAENSFCCLGMSRLA